MSEYQKIRIRDLTHEVNRLRQQLAEARALLSEVLGGMTKCEWGLMRFTVGPEWEERAQKAGAAAEAGGDRDVANNGLN